MPFSFSANWKACKGSSKCPCANHLSPASQLESLFRDPAYDDPTLHRVIYGNERVTPVEEDTVFGTVPGLESQLRKAEYRLRMLSRLQCALVAETQQVDVELKRVLEHRDALSRAIDIRMSIKAPIRTIPPEILTHILSFTIDIPVKRRKIDDSEDPILSMPWSIEPREHQLNTFQLVCKRWQRDILGCTHLWSQILILANPHETFGTAFQPRYTNYLQRHISRAGQSKLDVYIALSGNQVFYCNSHLSPHMLSVLEPVTARIRSLHITLPASMISDLIPLHKSLPSLETMDIHNLSPNATEKFPINLFGSVPKLKYYHIVDIPAPDTSINVPWHQITHYRTDYHACNRGTSEATLNMLQSARCVQSCILQMTSLGSLPLQVANTFITCERLQSLTIRVNRHKDLRGQPIRPVFTFCQFPVLHKLSVSTATKLAEWQPGYFPDGSETFHEMILCLQRSKSPLVSLMFDFSRVASQDVVELFRTMPNLEIVRMTKIEAGLDDDVIRSLCVEAGDVVAAPALHTLRLHGDLSCNLSVVADMVKGRWEHTPLACVYLTWSDMGCFGDSRQRRNGESAEQNRLMLERAHSWTQKAARITEQLQPYREEGLRLKLDVDKRKHYQVIAY